jgi:NADPH oxidase 1
MGESWFRREFLTGRRLAFNVIFYGLHFFFFGYGWYSQVGCLALALPIC